PICPPPPLPRLSKRLSPLPVWLWGPSPTCHQNRQEEKNWTRARTCSASELCFTKWPLDDRLSAARRWRSPLTLFWSDRQLRHCSQIQICRLNCSGLSIKPWKKIARCGTRARPSYELI